MTEATQPRFSIDFQQAGKGGNTASVAYNDPAEALRAYKDAAESFRASKQPPGAALSLNDQTSEFRAGVTSEGKGVVRHTWQHEAARESFDALKPSSEPRPELDAMRQSFIDTGKVSEFPAAKSVIGAPELGGSIERVERTATKEQAPGQKAEQDKTAGQGGDTPEKEDALRKRYLLTAQGYHDKQTMEIVIHDKGHKLATSREDVATIDALAVAVADRGWTSVSLSGTDAFKREAWYQMAARGVEVSGYKPNEADKARLQDVQRERVTQGVQEPKAGKQESKAEKKEPAQAPVVSPENEAAKAVRRAAPLVLDEPITPHEVQSLSAAANSAHSAAVATNAKNADKSIRSGQQPLKSRDIDESLGRFAGERSVMVNAVVRVAREGGLNGDRLEQVKQAATKLADQAKSVKPPKVADRAAIPQPVQPSTSNSKHNRDLQR